MADDEIQKYLEGVIGAVVADSYAQHMLWREYHHDRGQTRFTWVSTGHGFLEVVGYDNRRPVCISLMTATVAGHKILFYHATSRIVNHDKVRAWLDANMPTSAREEDGRINHTDATNFCNIFHGRERQLEAA